MQSPLLPVARIMDDLDDLLGIVRAASSGAYVVIVLLSIVLTITATASLGLRGLFAALLVCGLAVAAATLSSSRD